jgi:hypothetical protein
MTKRRRPGASKKVVEARFWGRDGEEGTPPPGGVRPTPDPGALIRSLGPPPLAVDPAVAERHLTAVYEEAVRAATALAAANGLLAIEDAAGS